jgi:hypothetical protein
LKFSNYITQHKEIASNKHLWRICPLELSRQKLREQALHHFKYIKTCVLARELCLLVRTNRVAFNIKDAQTCCSFISSLCKEAGCIEQSDLCSKASEAVGSSEEKYLELCLLSCRKCGEQKQPTLKKSAYVA